MRKGQNVMFEILNDFSLIGVSSDVLAFKVCVFASDFEFWIGVWILVDILTEILLTILLSIDHASRCQLNVCIMTHTKEKPSTTNWYISQNW